VEQWPLTWWAVPTPVYWQILRNPLQRSLLQFKHTCKHKEPFYSLVHIYGDKYVYWESLSHLQPFTTYLLYKIFVVETSKMVIKDTGCKNNSRRGCTCTHIHASGLCVHVHVCKCVSVCVRACVRACAQYKNQSQSCFLIGGGPRDLNGSGQTKQVCLSLCLRP